MLAQNISVPEAAIKDFCQRHKIRKLAFFGSILGTDFQPESDVDVLDVLKEAQVLYAIA